MIVEMPFLQRSSGRSPNRSDIRDMVCFDRDNMNLAEFSLSDFHRGAALGNGIGTLYKEGEHWAYFGTSVTGCMDNRPLDADGRARAMRNLSKMIDTTRFFDGGRLKLKLNRVMSEPLPSRWIESSEREIILARLREWVDGNVAMIDGHLALRVGEPSLVISATEPDKHGVCGLRVIRERLLPDLAHNTPGIHFPVGERSAMVDYARETVNTNPLTDSWNAMLEEGVLESMDEGIPTFDNMHERTLRSLAAEVVEKGPRGKNAKATQPDFDFLDTLDDMPKGQVEDSVLDDMMEHLVKVSRNVHPSTAILVEMAAAHWDDRPIAAAGMGLKNGTTAP